MKTYSSIPSEQERRKAISCPLCGSDKYRFRWTLGTSSFVKCKSCSLLYQNPQPVFLDLKERYDEEYFDYEVHNQSGFLSLMLMALNDCNFPMKEGNGKRFLDVGCATGALLEQMKNRGWSTQGIEICRPSAEYAINIRKIPVHIGTLEEWKGEDLSLDVFHSSHVIEHLTDARKFVHEAFRLLKKGGRFYCTTPNRGGWQAFWFGIRWRSLIEDHLILFHKRALIRLIKEEGFIIGQSKTWGGLAQGAGPGWLKKILDPLSKKLGKGDVMIIEGIKPL